MATKNVESLVLVGRSNGLVIIPTNTPLTRLNYFDGKFLRASDLKSEQDYLRQLVRLSNQAGGSGVVHGFDLTLAAGDTLDLGPGLGINPDGRVLLLPQEVSIGIQDLIEKSQQLQAFHKGKQPDANDVFGDCVMAGDAPPVNGSQPNDLYLIVVAPAEALCGEEDVYGKLCEEACSTSTDRPFAIEGIIVRAIPLIVRTPLPQSKAVPITTRLHFRSRVASAYFEDERQRVASMISKFGLAQQVWCLGADAAGGNGLPIGVIARSGGTTVFLDPWIARRERMDTPPRRYWQWRMMMRPWDVFLAQILQFQCQLRDLFDGGLTPGQEDPCGDARTVIGEAAKKLADFIQAQKDAPFKFASTADGVTSEDLFKTKLIELESMSQKLTATEAEMQVTTGNRLLIRNGFVELPSAGYLPVSPEAKMSVEDQVRQLMGEGVDLRFCIVRPDFVAHALEEAQHMERISLIQGLEDPKQKPKVDILIPDGELGAAPPPTRAGFAVDATLQTSITVARGEEPITSEGPADNFRGAARAEKLSTGGTAFYFAVSSPAATSPFFVTGVGQTVEVAGIAEAAAPAAAPAGIWLSLRSEDDFLALKPGDKTDLHGEVVIATGSKNQATLRYRGEVKAGLTVVPPKQAQFPIEGDLVASFVQESAPGTTAPGNDPDGSLTARSQGPTVEINLSIARADLQIKADWTNADKVQTELNVDVQITARASMGFDLSSALNKDENIFNTTDANHVRAVDALELGGAALKQADFVVKKSELLFPPVPIAPSATIRATRDWVLFHRRRDKNCGGVAVTTRRYQVYEAVLPAGSDPAESVPKLPPTVQAILSAKPDTFKQFLPVGIATFSEAALVGDQSALKSAWTKVPGNVILWSAIASQGDALQDGESLAVTRLVTLRSELDQVSPDARADVLPIVPPPLAKPDTDGVIVFIVGPTAVSADLEITKTATLGGTATSRIVTFEITAKNNGPGTAQDVTITDPTPPNSTFLSAQVLTGSGWTTTAPNAGATGTVSFTKASVPNGEQVVARITVNVGPNVTGSITNTATIKSKTSDPVTTNDSVTTVTNLGLPPPPPPVKITCLTTFGVLFESQLIDVRRELEQGRNVPTFAFALGVVNFEERTTKVPDNTLNNAAANWKGRGVGATRALLIMRKDAPAADKTAFRAQARAIVTAFQRTVANPPIDEVELGALPGLIQCQAGIVISGDAPG